MLQSLTLSVRGPCVAKVDDLVCIGMAVSMGGVGFAPPTVL